MKRWFTAPVLAPVLAPLLAPLLALMLLAAPVLAADVFPDLPLQGALGEGQAAYLGLDNGEARPSAVKADFLFVEVFSMYCPICQRDAPTINELFDKLRASDLAGRVRVLGIGTGNTAFEVDVFRNKFKVGFPLFEDPDYIWHKALGEEGTPAFFLVDLRGGRAVVYHHVGALEGADAALKTIRDLVSR